MLQVLEIELAMCYTKSVTASNGRFLLPSNSPIQIADCQESRPGSCDKPTRTPGSRHFVFEKHMPYIYLIRSQQCFKIGIANNPEVRILELQIGNPVKLELVVSYEFENADPVEWALHQKFAKKRVSGEWFALEQQEVDEFNRICSSFETVGNLLATRICTNCQQEKPANEFRKRWNFCKNCIKAYSKEYRAKNRKARREEKRRYRLRHKDAISERKKLRQAEKKQ
jgi:hypothetical protein